MTTTTILDGTIDLADLHGTTLATGNRYDVDQLDFAGFRLADGSRKDHIQGLHYADWFRDGGEYQGPDCDGIEPVFAADSVRRAGRTTTKAKATLIDRTTIEGAYGFRFTRAIVDHPTNGRIILSEGFGGMDSLAGGAYRWRHGRAFRAGPHTTIESLDGDLDMLFEDLQWSGAAVAKLAASLGL